MALGGAGDDFAGEVAVVQGAEESMGESKSIDFLSLISLPQDSAPKNTLAAMLERVRSQVSASAELSDDEDDVEESGHTGAGANPGAGAGTDGTTQKRSKYGCSQSELEKIRRERNRLHARKTRQRKKKMMQEMENIIRVLEDEVKELRAAKASSVSSSSSSSSSCSSSSSSSSSCSSSSSSSSVSSSSCSSVAMPAHSTAGDVRVGARRNHAVGSEREGATPQPQPQPVAESMARKRRCSIVSSVASSRSSSLLSVRSATSLSGMVMDDLVLRAVLGCGKDREQRLQKDQKGISSSSGNLYALARELDCDSADSAAAASLEDERSGCRQASPSPPPKPLELRTVMSFVTVDSLLQLSNNRSSSSSSSNGQLVPVKRTRDGDDETCIRAAQATKFANMGYVFESSSSSSSSGGSEEGDTVVSVSQVQGAYAYAAIHEDSPSF